MSWQCFGWIGNYCHSGSRYFISEKDGLCVEDHDQDYMPDAYPYTIYFVVLNQSNINRRGRVLVAYINDDEFYRASMKDSHNWAWISGVAAGEWHHGLYKFELQDRNGNVLCSKRVYLGEVPEEEPIIEEPEPSDVDYDRIVEGNALIVNAACDETISEINENQELINGVQNSVNDMSGVLSGQVASQSSEVKGLIAESALGLSGKVNRLIGGVTDGIKGLSDKIEELQFPNIADIKYAFMDVCADLAIALWDAILDKIEERYPDDDEERD